MMNIRNYVRAQSLEEAYDLLQKNKRNRVIGGMLWLKMTNVNVPTAIDLCDLGLDTIEETDEHFSIGAMVSLRQLEQHPALGTYTQNALAKSVGDIVGVQFRNMATVGGSIFGRFGFSDVLTMFLAMDTYVELYKEGLVPLTEFAARRKKERDILVRLLVKKQKGSFAYESMRNSKTDFPVLACAAGSWAGETRVVVGARPARAMVLTDAQGILKDGITEETAAAFAAYAAEHVPTSGNIRAGAAYRTHLIEVLTKRALLGLGGN